MLIDDLSPCSSTWTVLDADGIASIDAFLCRGTSLNPTVLVIAGIHGDEYEGPAAVARLSTRLCPQSICGSIVAVPVANPLAFSGGQRTTPNDGLNLARTFPGNTEGSTTVRLAAWIFKNLARRADFLIDLHSGGVEYRFLPLVGFYGKPDAENPSFQAARHFGLPVLWRLPKTQGVLSHEAWKEKVVSIGCEYLGAGQVSAEGVQSYVDGVLSCLALWGICPGESILPVEGQVVTGDWQLASAAGLFHLHCELGQKVSQGQLLAEIEDLRGTVLERFMAPAPGIVLGVRNKAYIREGNWGVLVACQ